MRVFTDETGLEWTAWEVRPGRTSFGYLERRSGGDRRVAAAPDPVIERRRTPDRRFRARAVATTVGPLVATGWLAFQAGAARRRLAPVPPDWQTLGDAELAALCRQAEPVPTSTQSA